MLLSHYTSRSGLEGIASTATLWATNFLTVNDTSEYFYAWREIHSAAIEYATKRLPKDLAPHLNVDATEIAQELRAQMASTDGYGHLYITSFALGNSPHHSTDGILTLWRCYTNLEGYCLQYEKDNLERMVRLESTCHNYAWVKLAPVEYGVDKDAPVFRELAVQVGKQLLLRVAQETGDGRIKLNLQDRWAPSYLAQKLMHYYGTHKNPSFEDEREYRILAYPLGHAEARPFTGAALKKTIHHAPNGKKHLVMGESRRPGIEPKRIIIGPKADPNIESILKLFKRRPEVEVCKIPIC